MGSSDGHSLVGRSFDCLEELDVGGPSDRNLPLCCRMFHRRSFKRSAMQDLPGDGEASACIEFQMFVASGSRELRAGGPDSGR